MQVHPNIDKKSWQIENVLKLKNVDKTYSLNSDVGLLKWRLTIGDEEDLPLILNVFANESFDGCFVNVEYILKNLNLTLREVIITIPLSLAAHPTVADVFENYEFIRSKSVLKWTIPWIDKNSDVGTFEFSVTNGYFDHFFPVHIEFWSNQLLFKLFVISVTTYDGSSSNAFTSLLHLNVEKYEIV